MPFTSDNPSIRNPKSEIRNGKPWRLCGASLSSIINGPGTPPRTAIVVAHPDDEIIGTGGMLPRFKDAVFIHVTDGAPEDMADAMAAGFKNREEYAGRRLQELDEALALAGCEPVRHIHLDYPDQAVSFSIPKLVHGLVNLFSRLQPEIVMTHPYEGGHPDHDTTAFGVHVARKVLQRTGFEPPNIVEFTSYHGRNDQIVTFEFLSPPSTSERGRQKRKVRKGGVSVCSGTRLLSTLSLSTTHGRKDIVRGNAVEKRKIIEYPRPRPRGRGRGEGSQSGLFPLTLFLSPRMVERRFLKSTGLRVRRDSEAKKPKAPRGGSEIVTVELTQAERELKHRMMACFRTQQKVLAAFRVEIERYRFAPLYDFSVPPHPGKLYYEHFPWGMTGNKWRRLAAEALECFKIKKPI